jgi:chromate transporter
LEPLTNKDLNSKWNSFIPLTLLVSKTALLAPTNFNLFLIFLKIGAILYGSGYVLLLFRCRIGSQRIANTNPLIDETNSRRDLFFFFGYFCRLSNQWNIRALISTLAIFLPSFVFVALLNLW